MNPPAADEQVQVCPSCGHKNPIEVWFCQNCGSPCKTYANPSTAPQTGDVAAPSTSEVDALSNKEVCPRCGQPYRPGELLCSNCGIHLASGKLSAMGTQKVGEEDMKSFLDKIATNRVTRMPVPEPETPPVPTVIGNPSADSVRVSLHIEGYTPSIDINLEPGREYVLGRRDETNSLVDVDFTPYEGYQKGVSRRQAVLELDEGQVKLRDLGSRNGTFLNGEKLPVSEPQNLQHQDKIALSKLVFRVYISA